MEQIPGLILFGIEIVLIVIAWRVGWRWRALLPSLAMLFVNMVVFSVVFFQRAPLAITVTASQTTRDEMTRKAIESIAANQWLTSWFYLSSLIVFGVLLLMIRNKNS